MAKICIFSIQDDLHALTIQKELRDRGTDCHVVEVDNLFDNNLINIGFPEQAAWLLDREKRRVEIGSLSLIWWRRSVRKQKNTDAIEDDIQLDLINNEFEATLLGLVYASFSGKWISDPWATRIGANKIIQTRHAIDHGFHVPETLFSQDPESVSSFLKRHDFDVVVKPVHGTNKMPIYTHKLHAGEVPDPDNIRICPTTYQQCIPGDIHFRVNVFGSKIYSFRLEAEELDWRPDLTVPFSVVSPGIELEAQMKSFLNRLNLEMGIFDFKQSSKDGKIYFFEVNPQGQFLFLQGITGFDLSGKMAEYLISEL